MGCLQQYQAEKIVEQATWISSKNIKNWYSSKEGFVISLVRLQRNCLFWTLITQPNDQFCCLMIHCCLIEQLTKLNNAVEEKRPELTNRKGVVFHRDNARPHASLVKIYWSLIGMFCHIHHIVLTLHHLITFCFDLYKTPWMVKISIMMMISNRTWFSFLIKTRSFMNVGLWCCLKDGKRSLIKMGNTLQNKVI